ncbi:hypothetical protein GCM10023324_22890 [Streptomyces youssoufiensis]
MLRIDGGARIATRVIFRTSSHPGLSIAVNEIIDADDPHATLLRDDAPHPHPTCPRPYLHPRPPTHLAPPHTTRTRHTPADVPLPPGAVPEPVGLAVEGPDPHLVCLPSVLVTSGGRTSSPGSPPRCAPTAR